MKRRFAVLIVSTIFVISTINLFAAATESGDWTMRKSDEAGKVEFSLMQSSKHHHSQNSSDWARTAFQGLDSTTAGRHDVHFTIVRDAGKFECEGFLRDGEGAGVFHFTPDASYAQRMDGLGFRGIDGEKQYEMAVQDVSVDFAKSMVGEHLRGLDTDKLIEFRIFGVDAKFIHDMRGAGLPANDSSRLVEFRIHGVTPEMARWVKDQGYAADEGKLVEMRIHGATPEFMDALAKVGYSKVPLDRLIEFRIHGVSPEFIAKLHDLGYVHPEPEKLVEMRIHGVTPEYIASMQAKGLKDLSVEKLVEMRIHGIE